MLTKIVSLPIDKILKLAGLNTDDYDDSQIAELLKKEIEPNNYLSASILSSLVMCLFSTSPNEDIDRLKQIKKELMDKTKTT